MAVSKGEKSRLFQSTKDSPLSNPFRRAEKERPRPEAHPSAARHGWGDGDGENPAAERLRPALTSASDVISALLAGRADEDSRVCHPSTTGATSSSEADGSVAAPRQTQSKANSRSDGLSSCLSSASLNDNQSTSLNSGENDGTGSSCTSLDSSTPTTHRSSRGRTSSQGSEDIGLEDISGSFNGRGASRLPDSTKPSAEKKVQVATSPKNEVTFAKGTRTSDGKDVPIKSKPASETKSSKVRRSSPVTITIPSSQTSNASQLLSEWNESPFVSSYPNQVHQQLVEVSTEDWCSEGLPWHIDVSKVVTGDVVASGSYGMVFKGIYKEDKVAVKVLLIPEAASKKELEKLQANFRQEVDLWYKLHHPNIVQFIGAYIGSPRWAIVTEFLHGGSLRAYLSRQQRRGLPTATIQSMALDIARGMEYLHENGIMHRDLKSANLLLDDKGAVKVADFGLARFEAEDAGNLTAETGTIRWMAPEVICHTRYTRKIDVYSFGIVLWELCTSLVPYEGMSFVQLAHAVANDHHRPPTADLPPFLTKLMRQCWDKDATNRPDFSVIVKYLEAVLADGPKALSSSSHKPIRVENGPTDSYSRPTISMRGGTVVSRTGNTRPPFKTYGDDKFSDDEEWVSIRKQCRCTIM